MHIHPKKAQASSLLLFGLASVGLCAAVYYFLGELDQPEYILYFSPIFGLLFYAAFHLRDSKKQTNFFHGAYPGKSSS
jgi:hypothetical protein